MSDGAKQVQWRRGTKAENDAYTGAAGEITVDLETPNLRIHDGITAGGLPTALAAQALSAIAAAAAALASQIAAAASAASATSAAVVAQSTINIKATIAAGLAASTGNGYVFTVLKGGSDNLTRTTTYEVQAGAAIVVLDSMSGTQFDSYPIATQDYVKAKNIQCNLVNPDNVSVSTAIKATGAIQTGIASTYYATDYMAVVPGASLISNGATNPGDGTLGWGFYDRNKVVITNTTVGVAPWTAVRVPAGAFFARCTFFTSTTPINSAAVYLAASLNDRQFISTAQISAYVAGLNLTNNLVVAANVTVGSAVNVDGTITTGLGSGFFATDYFSVIPGQSLVSNGKTDVDGAGHYGWHFYDLARQSISTLAGTAAGTSIAVPAGAHYARTSFAIATISIAACAVYPGTALPATAVPVVPKTISDFVVGLNLSGNLVNTNAYTVGSAMKSTGSVVTGVGTNFALSDYFTVHPGTTIASSLITDLTGDGTYGWAFYDINKTLISGLAGVQASVNVTVPDGAFYCRTSANFTGLLGKYWSITNTSHNHGRLAGKKWMPWGDSITAKLSGVYQSYVCNELGLAIPYQDARGGRQTNQLFEMYQVAGSPVVWGDPVNGLSSGGIINTALPQAAGDGSVAVGAVQLNQPGPWIAAGSTLAQTLATIDFVTIFLGANDPSFVSNIGAIGDPANGTTYYSYLRFVLEGFLNAKHDMKLMWICPTISTRYGDVNSVLALAQRTICEAYAIPYCDLLRKSGLNTINRDAYLQSDNLHPTSHGGIETVGRTLVGAFNSYF